jgi:uncharacterized protein (TIGR03083 family)
MEYQRLLDCLRADFSRLRQLAASSDPAARVPSCPEWTVDDLVRHVAEVYLHKTESMRQGRSPRQWPPDLSGEATLALLDRSYAELTNEFATRAPREVAATWYEPEQTVGFWIRRMAQETVIHRVDAELAAGVAVEQIPEDLAVDGIDEVLERFLGYGSQRWTEEFKPSLPDRDLPPVLVATDGYGWLVRATPDGAAVEVATPRTDAPAVVSGDPVPLLLWLWRRSVGGTGGIRADGVDLDGDLELIGKLHVLLHDATQ